MKQIFVAGREEEVHEIQKILETVNASCRVYYSVESLLEDARKGAPNLLVIAFGTTVKTETAIQQIKKESALSSAPVLAFYPQFVASVESRAREIGASDVLSFPVDRREFLAKTGTLLNIGKRRTFKALLTIESGSRTFSGTSEDFGDGGVSFVSDEAFPEKHSLKIQFFLPGLTERLRLQVVIVRKIPLTERKYFYGARFVEVDPAIAEKIRAFVERIR